MHLTNLFTFIPDFSFTFAISTESVFNLRTLFPEASFCLKWHETWRWTFSVSGLFCAAIIALSTTSVNFGLTADFRSRHSYSRMKICNKAYVLIAITHQIMKWVSFETSLCWRRQSWYLFCFFWLRLLPVTSYTCGAYSICFLTSVKQMHSSCMTAVTDLDRINIRSCSLHDKSKIFIRNAIFRKDFLLWIPDYSEKLFIIFDCLTKIPEGIVSFLTALFSLHYL